MKKYNLNVLIGNTDTVQDIMRELSKYDCDFQLKTESKVNKSTYAYEGVSYCKLGEADKLTPSQYKKDMKFYRAASQVLISNGILPKYKGYNYSMECIRLMLIYGNSSYQMDNDIYPVIGSWYDVSPKSVEHDIRNSIGIAWKNAEKNSDNANLIIKSFNKKPSNLKLMKQMAKMTNYFLQDNAEN